MPNQGVVNGHWVGSKRVGCKALPVVESTSLVSIAKFGVCSKKLSDSNQVQYQIEQTRLQECDVLTQYTIYACIEEQTIMNFVTGVQTLAHGEHLDVLSLMELSASITSHQESHTLVPLLGEEDAQPRRKDQGTQLPSS